MDATKQHSKGNIDKNNMRELDCTRDAIRLVNEYAGESVEEGATEREEDICVLVQKQAKATITEE